MHIVTLPQFPVEAKTEQVVGCHRLELSFCLELSKAKIYSLIWKDIFLKFCAGIEATPSVFSLCFLGKHHRAQLHISEKLKTGLFPSLAESVEWRTQQLLCILETWKGSTAQTAVIRSSQTWAEVEWSFGLPRTQRCSSWRVSSA